MEFVFVAEEHEEYGSLGWRLKSQPDFDPLGGMAVAHDCLEHFSDSPNPADEFMALGASLFVRNYYYYSQHGRLETRPGAHIAADLPEIMRRILHEGYDFPSAPVTRKGDEDLEENIAVMFSKFKRNLDEDERKEFRLTLDTKRSITSYLRIGYRKAVKRYQGRSNEARRLFENIESGADRILKGANEGDELVVKVNFRDLTCKVFSRWDEH